MLDRLLQLLARGGVRTVADLAAELQTAPELVELMLERLEAQGKLVRMNSACSGACAGCAFKHTCAVKLRGAGYAPASSPGGPAGADSARAAE